jgi:hypothetical protein
MLVSFKLSLNQIFVINYIQTVAINYHQKNTKANIISTIYLIPDKKIPVILYFLSPEGYETQYIIGELYACAENVGNVSLPT